MHPVSHLSICIYYNLSSLPIPLRLWFPAIFYFIIFFYRNREKMVLSQHKERRGRCSFCYVPIFPDSYLIYTFGLKNRFSLFQCHIVRWFFQLASILCKPFQNIFFKVTVVSLIILTSDCFHCIDGKPVIVTADEYRIFCVHV